MSILFGPTGAQPNLSQGDVGITSQGISVRKVEVVLVIFLHDSL